MFLALSYHIINRAIRDKIAISEEAFEAQLDYLQERGYTTLSLEQAIADSVGEQASPPRSVLLTFDDGYSDNARVALPLLQARNMPATLFVISAYVGQNNRWNPKACYDVEHMSWDELRLWQACGCDVGWHSHFHYCMTRLHPRELQETVRVNKHLLEEKLGITLRAFAFPYGGFNQVVMQVIRQHYEIAFAIEDGSWNARSQPCAINRMTVFPAWSIEDFAKQLDRHFTLWQQA